MASSSKRDIILFVGNLLGSANDIVRAYNKRYKKHYKLGLFIDETQSKNEHIKKAITHADIVIICDSNSPISILKALLPYQDRIFSVTARGEFYISLLARIAPHIPYVKTPTSESLIWSTDKLMMRRRMRVYNKKIIPKYTVVSDTSKKSLKKIEEKVGFPLVAKPTGLAASKYVSICFHKQELESVLRRIFRHMQVESKKANKEQRLLVEQFMEGDMYSVDSYVSSRGTVYFCPMVHIKTGKTIGFDDFFGYQQITPTLLKRLSIEKAHDTTTQAIHALGLRSTTVHVELIKFEDQWKIIELSPRIGGFRHDMYQFSYGINHTMNDILIHAGIRPDIPKKRKGYTVAMKFFAKKEGRLSKLKGIKKAQELQSFKSLHLKKKIGDMCLYAKHGGGSVFDIIMFNFERSILLADVRRLEQMIVIETSKK